MNLELLFLIPLSEVYCYDSFRTVTVASAQSTAKVCCATKDSFMIASIASLSTITAYASSNFQCLRDTSHYGNLVHFTGHLFTNYVCRQPPRDLSQPTPNAELQSLGLLLPTFWVNAMKYSMERWYHVVQLCLSQQKCRILEPRPLTCHFHTPDDAC